MGRVQVLDCTLRDGGYVNNWEFGAENIPNIISGLEKTGVDVIELGFMRKEPYQSNRTIFNATDQIEKLIGNKKKGTLYAALIEMANYFPLEMLPVRTEKGPDIIRYSFWMRCLDEAFAYAERIARKGYKLGIQPTRVEQYTEEQFARMCERFSTLKPYAIYIVDTFGLLTKEQLIRYATIADEYVEEGILIGYHAHNNMQQAFANAVTFVELGLRHDQIADASVYGMGRGAGNLNLEVFCNYLNVMQDRKYDLEMIFHVWDACIKDIYRQLPWGYSMEYFIAAMNQCNPIYISHFFNNHPDIKTDELSRIVERMMGDEKFLFSEETAERLYREMCL